MQPGDNRATIASSPSSSVNKEIDAPNNRYGIRADTTARRHDVSNDLGRLRTIEFGYPDQVQDRNPVGLERGTAVENPVHAKLIRSRSRQFEPYAPDPGAQ